MPVLTLSFNPKTSFESRQSSCTEHARDELKVQAPFGCSIWRGKEERLGGGGVVSSHDMD